jgi:helicase MOV-10
VAITRAQALLIIIGDPSVLCLDPLWRSFLNYIYINGGWTGPSSISWDPDAPVREEGGYDAEIREAALNDMNEFARRMEAMTLSAAAEAPEEIDEADANQDRPWRENE